MEKYENVKKIGEGSFGKAILVKSKEDERQYVIKEIGISRMSSQERQESRKEVAVLATMRHPNIVQYKESFEEGGCLYIVMDYCEGGDLFKKINSQRGVLFSEDQILNWFVQICLALKHVHDRKILHRDIKSQNIFLTKDGTVQLGDFGIARVLNSTVELARTWIGTPYYLSPEICENKPYNNKSDIWALGCVLYEMCTLKHAFEAGNMKNLVLKIIRGSFPPVSVHYSQELRSLLVQLFKRNPRERPSVSSILDKPFLACRIEKFLSPQIIAQEFHHHVFHKQPKAGVVQGPPAKHPAPGCTPVTPAQKISKPACKSRVPLTAQKMSDGARKPAEKNPAMKHKPAPHAAAPQRRVSQVEEERKKHEEGCKKKKMELIEKERKKREQMFLLKAEQMKRYEKEKLNRINQAREQGWKHVLSLSGGSSPEKKCFVGGVKRGVPGALHGLAPAPVANKNLYEHHYAALEQLTKPQPKVITAEGSAGPGSPIRGLRAAAAPGPPNGPAAPPNPDFLKRELQKLQKVSNQPPFSRQCTPIARGRTHQVEEFLQRKREAMLNKVRAEGQLEYLLRLRQIRLQNFNERQQIKARLRGERYDSDGSDSQESSEEAELRRKKIEALKAQANARAAVLKEQLEKKRREAHEKEKKAWEEHLAARGMKVSSAAGANMAEATAASSPSHSPPPPPPPPPPPACGPPEHEPAAKASVLPVPELQTSSAVSMTAALKNVGAITPMKEGLPDLERATIIQSEKKEILRRLNQNLKEQGPVAEEEPLTPPPAEPCTAVQEKQSDPGEQPSSNRDRKKWEAGELFVLPVAQHTLEETGSTINASYVSPEKPPSSAGDRKKWEAGVLLVPSVAQQTLEETSCTTIAQTAGVDIQMCGPHEEAPRKVWPVGPDSQVLRVLQEAELQPLTQELGNISLCDEESSSPDKPNQMVEPMKSPKEELPSGPAVVPSPEVQMQSTTGASPQETSVALPQPPSLTESQDPDVESLLLDEEPKQVLDCAPEVQEAWEQESQQQMPPGGNPGPAVSKDEEEGEEKPNESSGIEEPLFLKLCSPAHRRAAALAILSAQSSVEDSSSSLTSRSRSVSPLRSKTHNALLIGLSTGMFDTNNPKMLRTCSLPDLSRLFGVQQSSAGTDASTAPDNNLEVEDLDEAAKDEEQSENEDASEDEDLQNIRASMERLLHEEGDLMEGAPELSAGDFNGNPPEGPELFNSLATEIDQDNINMAVDDDDEADEDEEEEDDDGEEEEAEEDDCSNGSPAEEDHSNKSHLNEEWHSDGSGEDQCAEAPYHDSIFSRLEELRFNLEQQMGLEKCIQAYNKIKAIHEDEDENIDQGSSLVLSILGTEHQHLYPNILHLVMADGAYQEGNDA